MTRSFARLLVSAAMIAVPLTVTTVVATPAQAASSCVSKAEFRKVKKHMAIKKVHRIFDTNGKQSFVMDGYQSREYKTCTSKYGFVMVDFDHGKVYSKAAFWG